MMAVPIFVAGYISSRRPRLVLVVGDDGCFRFPPLSSAYLGLFVGDDGCFRFRYRAAQSVLLVFRDDGCFRFPPKNQEDIVLLPVSGVGVGVGVLVPWLGRAREFGVAFHDFFGCGCVFRLFYLLLSKENRSRYRRR